MTLRFIKCLVVVAVVHVFAAVLVFGAYHLAKSGNGNGVAKAPADQEPYKVIAAQNGPSKQPEAPAVQEKTHVVASGESYWSIAKQYEVSTKDLMEYNGGADRTLRPGDVLKIPR